VAVFLAQVGDVGSAASKIRSPSSPRSATRTKSLMLVDRRAVAGFELQMPEAEGRRLGRHGGPAHVVGWRVRQDLVDHAGPVEADHDRSPPRDRRGLVAADVLQSAQKPFDVGGLPRAGRGPGRAPAQKDPKVRLSV